MKEEGTIYHLQVSVDAARWPDEMLQHFERPDGSEVTPDEVRAYMDDLKARGYRLLPCCGNVDERGACQGSQEPLSA